MIEIHGLEEAIEHLEGLIRRLSPGEAWDALLGGLANDGRRHAASISPVVSGSYRDAHMTSMGRMKAVLSIDPGARNAGVSVQRYAGNVENRHNVYGRTASHIDTLVEDAVEEFINGE